MALWKEAATPKKDAPTMTPDPVLKRDNEVFAEPLTPIPSGPRRAPEP